MKSILLGKVPLSKNLKTIIRNFFSLSIMYGLDMLLPLITIPYLIRYIGLDKVGLLNFAAATIAYFGIIVNYGFNLTATKEVALNSENPKELERIFNSVTTTKLVLIIISAIVLLLLLLIVPKFREFYYLYLIIFIGVCFQNLLPIWFFQGMQNLRGITIQNTLIKLFFTVLIFFLVKKESDFWIVPILTGAGFLCACVLSYVYAYKVYELRYVISSIKNVKKQLHTGLYVFLSQVKISFFSNLNVLILGFIAGNTAVAYFTSADKVIRALAVIQIPVVTSLFPYFSNLLKIDKVAAYKNINKIALLGSFLYLPIILLIFIFSHEVVSFIFGDGMESAEKIVRILCLLPLFIFLNNLSGTQMLLNMGKDRLFFNVLLSTAILNVLLVFPLTYKYSFYGTAISVFISELFLCVVMYIVFLIAKKNY